MLKRLAGTLGALCLAAPVAMAQQEVDADLLAQGEELYATNCAICHQATGAGRAPAFPALAGNANLADVGLVAATIRGGRVGMPPFPTLDDQEVAAVATYVRNAWGNSFGGASVEEVAEVLEGWDVVEPVSIWSGVYARAQGEAGQMVARASCAECHGERLDGAALDPDRPGSPAIARARFLREWEGRSLGTLFEFMRGTMPPSSPGFLSDEQYLEIVAHILAVSGTPTGSEPLTADPDALGAIIIEQTAP